MKIQNLMIGLLAVAALLVGAEQVGTVSCSGVCKVRSDRVPAPAAQGIVLASGDEVETLTEPATIVLDDGSRLTVAAGSLVKIIRIGGRLQVSVGRGSIRFSASPGSKMRVCANARLIEPSAPSEGVISLEGAEKVNAVAEKGTIKVDEAAACSYDSTQGNWLTKNKAIVVVSAASAAGAVAGVAVTRPEPPPPPPPPPPVSPSK